MGLFYHLAVIKRKINRKRRRGKKPEIPMDLVIEILTRLPAKALMRFKSLSNLYSSLICSQYLSNRFLARRSPRLYMCLSDRKDYRQSVILSSAPSDTGTSFVVDHDLTIPGEGCGHIHHNLGGFMCFKLFRKLKICNPATRQLVSLPAIETNFYTCTGKKKDINITCYYLVHDPVNDQYKVICSIGKLGFLSEQWIFVLKAGGSWKKVSQDFGPPHLTVKRGFSINGVLYYLGWTSFSNSVVVSFDIKSQEFKMIQVPRMEGDEDVRVKDVRLIEYGGKATFLDKTNLSDKGIVDLWILGDAENEEWSRKTMVLRPSQLHLVSNNIRLLISGTTQNGNVLLIPEDLVSPFYVLSYDIQNNDMTRIEIKGIPDHWLSKGKSTFFFDLMFMDNSESVMRLDHDYL